MRSRHRHISGQYESALDAVQLLFSKMGGIVEDQLSKAMHAFAQNDIEVALEVRNNEETVNEYEKLIDQETVKIIALRQPAATDLRLLVSLLKSGTDLERVGDEAKRIAKITIENPTLNPESEIAAVISHMFDRVGSMLRTALDTFARFDDEEALVNIQRDEEVDASFKRIVELTNDGMLENPDHVEDYLASIWVARALERIGDHAKNISENVCYLKEGKDVRHPG